MKISSAQAAAAQATQGQATTPNGRDAAASSDVRGIRVRADRLELSGGANGQSSEDRVSAFADRVHERLENLARRRGVDVSGLLSEFDKNIGRIQDALAAGELDSRELASALKGTMDVLRGDLAEAIDPEMTDGVTFDGGGVGEVDPTAARRGGGLEGPEVEPDVTTQRVNDLAEGVRERITSLLADLGRDAGEGLQSALSSFDQNISRILDGIADGSLAGEDLARAVQGTLDLVGQDVQRALGGDEGTVDAAAASRLRGGPEGEADVASPAETRIDAFRDQVTERFAGLDTSGLDDAQMAALRDAHTEFESSIARLESAFFENGEIGRQELFALFSDVFENLQSQLGEIFGGETPERVSLYHPVTGVERLDGTTPAGIDTTV